MEMIDLQIAARALSGSLSNLQADTNMEQALPVGTNLHCISMFDIVLILNG